MTRKISRREALATATAAGAAIAMRTRAAASERPNFLWLVSEDNNPFIGAYGDKLAHIPAIDQLAAEGILYKNAYCNARLRAVAFRDHHWRSTGELWPRAQHAGQCLPSAHATRISRIPSQGRLLLHQ
jgi:Sulfatase